MLSNLSTKIGAEDPDWAVEHRIALALPQTPLDSTCQSEHIDGRVLPE